MCFSGMNRFGDLFLLFVSLICGRSGLSFLWECTFLPVFEHLELLAVFFDVSFSVAEPATHLGSDSLSGGDFDVSSINVCDIWGMCFPIAAFLVSYPLWVQLVWFQFPLEVERCARGSGVHHGRCIGSSGDFAPVFSCGASVSMSPVSIWFGQLFIHR